MVIPVWPNQERKTFQLLSFMSNKPYDCFRSKWCLNIIYNSVITSKNSDRAFLCSLPSLLRMKCCRSWAYIQRSTQFFASNLLFYRIRGPAFYSTASRQSGKRSMRFSIKINVVKYYVTPKYISSFNSTLWNKALVLTDTLPKFLYHEVWWVSFCPSC